jgi:hypothetical protein
MPQIFSARHFMLAVGSNSDSREVASSDAACILDDPKRVSAGFPALECETSRPILSYLAVR